MAKQFGKGRDAIHVYAGQGSKRDNGPYVRFQIGPYGRGTNRNSTYLNASEGIGLAVSIPTEVQNHFERA